MCSGLAATGLSLARGRGSRLSLPEVGGRRPVSSKSAMSSRDVVSSFWEAMCANDWEGAARCLAAECVIEWPCSGERIVGRADFAAIQARYPTTTGWWSFDVHRLVVDQAIVVSEVTVTDGQQSARLVAFSEVAGDHIVRQIEYWPVAYDPPAGREDLTTPGDRIP